MTNMACHGIIIPKIKKLLREFFFQVPEVKFKELQVINVVYIIPEREH
jgi:hypothetical protein